MISVRFLALLSTLLLVVGALLVGDAIHGSVVTGTYDVTSPAAVLRAVVGIVFLALGARYQKSTEEYVAMPSGDPERQAESADPDDEPGEFDADLSPLGEDGLEHADADDDRRE